MRGAHANGRRVRVVPMMIGVGLLLAGCTHAHRSRHATQRPSPATAVSTTSGLVGSRTNPRVRRCVDGGVESDDPTGPNDVVAGPLSYPNMQMLARRGSASTFYGGGVGVGPGGLRFYKMGTYVKAGAVLTVSVLPPALSFARLQSQGTNLPGDEAVTFEACADGAATSWVGGFDLIGRSSACVPLEIEVKGEAQPRRIVVSLFHGTCPPE